MLAILSPILVFGLVVFVHELGHFLAAKATGVYAPRFSIGFGPALFRRRHGETEYILAILPLGGYVRMASRHDEEASVLEGGNETSNARAAGDPGYDPEAMMPFGPKPVPEDRWFESKPLPARLFIMIAGVTMNALLAWVLAIALAFHYGRPVYPSTVIGAVHATAETPGLDHLGPGDTIQAVNGHPVRTWDDVRKRILASADTATLQTSRGTVAVPVAASGPDAIADALVYYIPPVIDSIVPDDRADRAGLRRGDSVVAVNGHPIRSWTEMVGLVAASPDSPVRIALTRAGRVDSLTVTPRTATDTDAVTGATKVVGKIGAAAPDLTRTEPVGLVDALGVGSRLTVDMAGAIVRVVYSLFSGATSVRQLGGPVAISRASVEAARRGVDQLLYLIALLSINVAVLNLLPIPILDGGQILINVLESAKGSPFSLRTREYILRVGLAAIALLFAIVMYNDTRGAFARLFGWVAGWFG